jgi:hypothetical protein
MSQPKHTPGPWTLGYSINNVAMEEHDRVNPICSLDLHPGGVTEANARLIAASPMLLKALKSTLDAFRTCIGNEAFNDFVLGNSAVIAAHQAITKATGGAE